MANGYDPESVYGTEFEVREMNWISGFRSQISDFELKVKIRHGAKSHPCTVEVDGDLVKVKLTEKVHGIAAGQFAVFYLPSRQAGDGDVCLGGGIIT